MTSQEVSGTLGPDQPFRGSTQVHLVQFGPHGVFGFIISGVDTLGSFLLGPPKPSPQRQRHYQKAGPEHPGPQDPNIDPRIPNPVVCLVAGDVILFQLHILPHNRSASHYPVYQKQHLFNSNPHWDFGTFRRLGHLVRETHLNFSRFAHQFLDPGTYVFQDNGRPEGLAVVLVKEDGVACGPNLSPVQPSSPYQLGRHGVLRHRLQNLGPDWAAITGVLLAVGLAVSMLTGLGLLLRPSPPHTSPTRAWRPQWRSLGQPHVPAEYVLLGDRLHVECGAAVCVWALRLAFPCSLLFHEDPGPRGSGDGADSREKTMTQGPGEPLPAQTLEDFSIRTLYDKLEDQSLHVAAQLSKHRSDALAFYGAIRQQLQGLQDFLQGISTTEQQALGRGRDLEMQAKAAARTDTGQSKEPQGGHIAASPREQQPPLGCTPSISALGFQPELDRVIVALASALSHACGPPARASREASSQPGDPSPSASPWHVVLAAQPPPVAEQQRSASPQQDPGPTRLPHDDAKELDAESTGPGEWTLGAGHDHGATPELQRKIWQVEDALDELNEEFFQLSSQALELQKEEDEPDPLPPVEGSTFMVAPSISPCEWQEDRLHPLETNGPQGEKLGTWALKSHQALELEVRRVHLAQRIEDLEWELSLLLQVANSSSSMGGSWPSRHSGLRGTESHQMLHGGHLWEVPSQQEHERVPLAGRSGHLGPGVCAGVTTCSYRETPGFLSEPGPQLVLNSALNFLG
ncbi:uncharacterized protein [Eulemur rufifrons]|uniref:uncharacterized protein n=1 Tax=Eulemur rufifrons TaxID=859984 RepID=UPI00374290A1